MMKSDSGNTDSENHLFGHGILENQIQVLSRAFRHRFKNFQGPCMFLRTFQALKMWKKMQGLSRICKNPVKRCNIGQQWK